MTASARPKDVERFLDCRVESNKKGHAALLLLKLEAANARYSRFYQQPEAQHSTIDVKLLHAKIGELTLDIDHSE